MVAILGHGVHLGLGGQHLGEILGEAVGHVDTEAINATIRPETQGGKEFSCTLRLFQLVRLLTSEEVAVPLAGGAARLEQPGSSPSR